MSSNERELARKLYVTGYTYDQLSKRMGKSKSTLSNWCGDLALERRKAQAYAKGARKPQKVRLPSGIDTTKSIKGTGPFEGYWVNHKQTKSGARVLVRNPAIKHKVEMPLTRYLMAVELGRWLLPTEMVVHLNGPEDAVSNLAVIVKGQPGPPRVVGGKVVGAIKECVICEAEFRPVLAKTETCSKLCRYALVGLLNTRRALDRKAPPSK